MQPNVVPTNKTQVATYLSDYFYKRFSWLCFKYGKSASGLSREAVEAYLRAAESRGDLDDMPHDWGEAE